MTYYVTRKGGLDYTHKLVAVILSLVVCYSMYQSTSSYEYIIAMSMTSIFYACIEYLGATQSVRKGQALSTQASLAGYPISVLVSSMLRGFGEMGACMLFPYIASDYHLYPNKFDRNSQLMMWCSFGIYAAVMMIVFPSFGKKAKLISNRAMTKVGVLAFMAFMASIDIWGYVTLNAQQKQKLKWFFIFESLFIFQWNMFAYFVSKKRYISVDEKGTECDNAVIQILLLLYDSVVEMAVIISPFVVATLKCV